MSKMKPTMAATLLTLVLAIPVLAGNIGSPGGTPPPPPPPPTIENMCPATPPTQGASGSAEMRSRLVDIVIAVLSMI